MYYSEFKNTATKLFIEYRDRNHEEIEEKIGIDRFDKYGVAYLLEYFTLYS